MTDHGEAHPPGTHRHPVRIYYEDTDFSGVVYHASYLRFLERGRTEFLRAVGIHQGRLLAAGTAAGLGFVVRRMTIDFRKPARMDDLVVVTTGIRDVGGASLALDQQVTRDAEILVAADVRIAVVANGRATRLPPELRSLLRAQA